MERLTFIDHLGWYVNGNGGERIRGSHINRLAAYEGSGLEPEEIADFMKRWEQAVEIGGMLKKYGIDHIWDIIQAEQDGRLVMLGEGENHG